MKKIGFLLLVGCAAALSFPVQGNELEKQSERKPQTEEQLQPRSLSITERMRLKEKWMDLNKKNPIEMEKLPANSVEVKHKEEDGSNLQTASTYSYQLLTEAAHWVSDAGILGDWIEIEDGSMWHIAFSDQYEVRKWFLSDTVYVTQSDNLLYGYDYMIVNANRGTVVYANRDAKPYYYGANTNYIVIIDRYSDRILLNDGSWWNVSWIDDSVMQHWLENDTIILGLNSGYDAFSYPFILINVSVDTYNLGLDEWVAAQRSY